MKENKFQADLRKELEEMFPGCIVSKNDPNDRQGMPDLAVYYKDRYAHLECKRSKDAPHQPNQDYYVKKLNEMSFARFIYPENKEEVLDELQQAFRSRRKTRISKRK